MDDLYEFEKETLTQKDIQKATGASASTIQYLKSEMRLPIAKHSPGRGFPTQYKKSAIDVINNHINKR